MKTIDLNADIGEGCDDAAVVPYISSANIACGLHAGDARTMRSTVELCVRHGVAVGAHPSFDDRQGFGRREMHLAPDEAYALTARQLGALADIARAAGATLHHVKPHGALYNMAARDRALADAIARAVRDFDATLVLFGLAGSMSIDAAQDAGLATASEAFCDRRYRIDGSLMPRGEPGAVIEDIDDAVAQAVSIATRNGAFTAEGVPVAIDADTLCVHGDRPDAGLFAQRLRETLHANGVRIATMVARG